MSFLANLRDGFRFAREMRSATSTFTNPADWLLQALGGGPTKSGASVNENTAFNVSAVRACVNLRANLLAMLPLKVFQKTTTGPVEQREHRLARMFRGRVSPMHTKFKWIHASSVCEDIGGDAYSRVYRDQYAVPERIQWVKPPEVTPLENKATGDIGYRLQGQGNLLAYEMLHISGLSTNGRTGRSPLADLREAVGLSLTAEEFTGRTFQNGNRKPGVLVGGPGMNKSKADEFLAFWMQHYAGAANAGKSPLLFGGMEWRDAGFSNADAELLGMRKFSIEEIARVYQIPLHLVGSTDKATTWGSGIEQLNQGLVDYMLAPRCTNWEAEMNTTLLTEREQDEGFYIKFWVDALLRGSPETRAKVYQIMRGLRAISVNEIRNREDMIEAPDTGANNLDWPLNNQGGGGQPSGAPVVKTKEDES
jgi:HK97 family phage portal protein